MRWPGKDRLVNEFWQALEVYKWEFHTMCPEANTVAEQFVFVSA